LAVLQGVPEKNAQSLKHRKFAIVKHREMMFSTQRLEIN